MYFTTTSCLSIDIRECQRGLHNCSQICNELEGGFSCACNVGYELASDRTSCRGMLVCIKTNRCISFHQMLMNADCQYQNANNDA